MRAMARTLLGAWVALALALPISAEAGGWYLLAQPVWLLSDPIYLSRMEQLGSFDSATACETARVKEINQANREWSDVMHLKKMVPDWDESIERAVLKRAGTLRCISSDDPRLREGTQ